MRHQGNSLIKISDYLNNQGYYRTIKRDSRKVNMDKRILTRLFKDPFYYGILIQGVKKIDLRAIYDFQPATTEEVYLEIQGLSHNRKLPIATRKSFYPFRTFVRCYYCDSHMTIGPSTGNTQRYLYLRCETEGCNRKKKSVRIKFLLEFIYNFLETGLDFTEDDYKQYQQEMEEVIVEKRTKLEVELHSKQAKLRKTEQDIRNIAIKILEFEEGSTVRTINEDRINQLEAQKEDLEVEITKLKQALPRIDQDALTLEQFLNLSKMRLHTSIKEMRLLKTQSAELFS